MPKKGKHREKGSAESGGEEENVKVAVRVRPFNKREHERNAKCIVDMVGGKQTVLRNPKDPDGHTKPFAYDYSYWSYDGGVERKDGFWEADPSHKNANKFADQNRVFQDLGVGILKNAWDGYNSTLFAYGQTGSGKSYSVVGYGANKGIVPMFCEKLFQEIDTKKATATKDQGFEVTFTMLEIYNEIVRDLLNPGGDKKRGLKVRESPKKGFYAEKLSVHPVDSYKAIEDKMNEGTTNRTIASTNMNATSSRAHTIVGITFVQKSKNAAGKEYAKTSVNNLVDLAGSERVASTGATGDRLKEGAAINQSLSALGNVISALADQSEGKKVKVPYRDSVLTKLLMNALGGNSKTIMIAAISPADINYEESMSTLRYADRAKQIKTKATINEDPTEKLIRELQEENARLLAQMKKGGVVVDGGSADLTPQEKKDLEEEYKAQLEENEREMAEMKKSFEEKLAQAHSLDAAAGGKSASEVQRQRGKYPHLYNLNMDPQLNGMIVHILKSGTHKIGNQKGGKSEIVLKGPSMQEQHARISCSKNHMDIRLEPAVETARTLVNGSPLVSGGMSLHHNDRIMFGTTQMYVFANPTELKKYPDVKYPNITFEMAQEEIAGNSGFDMNRGGEKSEGDLLLQEDLLDVMPAVEEANSISESLDKMVKFEMLLVSPEALGKTTGGSEVYVRVRNFANGLQYEWPKEKFLNRFYKMQELYEDVEEGEVSLKDLPDNKDPFTEPEEEPIRIGCCSIYLKSLAYIIEMKSQLEITDLRGNEVGLLNTEIIPCDSKGQQYTEQSDVWIDNPKDLQGQDLYFTLKINSARGLPLRFTDIQCRYRFFADKAKTETKPIPDTNNPDFNHKKSFSFKPVSQEALNYLMEGRILVELWGLQMPIKRERVGNTKSMLEADAKSRSAVSAVNDNKKVIDLGKVKSQMEATVLKKRQEQMENKVHYLREMVKIGEQKGMNQVPLTYVKGILDAPSTDVLDKWSAMFSDQKTNGLLDHGSRPSSNNRISPKSGACVIS